MIIENIKVENKEDLHEHLYSHSESFRRYIKNDFTRDILKELAPDIYRGNNRTKRLYTIFFVIISAIFFYIKSKYFFVINTININMYFYSLFLVFLLYMIHRNINVYDKELDDFK